MQRLRRKPTTTPPTTTTTPRPASSVELTNAKVQKKVPANKNNDSFLFGSLLNFIQPPTTAATTTTTKKPQNRRKYSSRFPTKPPRPKPFNPDLTKDTFNDGYFVDVKRRKVVGDRRSEKKSKGWFIWKKSGTSGEPDPEIEDPGVSEFPESENVLRRIVSDVLFTPILSFSSK